MVNPLVVATLLNATSADIAVERAALTSQGTDPSITTQWASVNQDSCAVQEESGSPPQVGDTGCTATHGEGAIAWGSERFFANQTDWMLTCFQDTWMWNGRERRMEEFVESGQKWVIVQTSTFFLSSGTYNAVFELNAQCVADAPSGWRNGGRIAICVGALLKCQFVATICNIANDGDSPACATDTMANSVNYDMIGSDDCPSPGILDPLPGTA